MNALTGVIITYLTFVLPFAVWTLRGFILSIPKELEEAALVDGNSKVGAFTRILLPLIAPGLVATSVFAFISCWNEYIFARVLLNDQSKQTVTVWLSYFLGSSKHTDWGALMAGVDADRDPGCGLLPPRAAQDLVRPDRGRSQGVTRFEWRGVMLDVARHFFGVEDVKRFVDVIARFGFNRLHLHLTDDQGWRIEIESWPRLAEAGGASAVGGGAGGFYTQRDYVEIVEHAASRDVVVVPEIDMPGHVNAAVVAYPELSLPGLDVAPYTGTDVGFSCLDVTSKRVHEFVDDVLRELAELTPGPYLHIGGDEVFKIPHEHYVSFVEHACARARAHGKVPVGWEEIAQSRLEPGTIVQHWKDPEHAREAVRQGARVLMSPGERTYFDHKYDASDEARHRVGGPRLRARRVRVGSGDARGRRRGGRHRRRRGVPLDGDDGDVRRRRVHGVPAPARACGGRRDASRKT